MAVEAQYLADKSALGRMDRVPVAARLVPLIERRLVATCSIVDLEVLFSAQSPADYRDTRTALGYAYPFVPIDQPVFDRAIEVQGMLAEQGRHRGASLPDLIVAAAAESEGLTTLHYDADFDLIATVTRQKVEWVVPRGSVD